MNGLCVFIQHNKKLYIAMFLVNLHKRKLKLFLQIKKLRWMKELIYNKV